MLRGIYHPGHPVNGVLLAPELDSRNDRFVPASKSAISASAHAIECAEAQSSLAAAAARREVIGKHLVIDHLAEADAISVFAGHWTHLTHSLVLRNQLTVQALPQLEHFFSHYLALTTVHVSDEFPDAVNLLTARGYELLGEALVVALTPSDPVCSINQTVPVERATVPEWIPLSSAGFLGRTPDDESALETGAIAANMADVDLYLARVNGRPAASGATFRAGPVSILFCDSTLAEYRGSGLHTQLIAARTNIERERGAQLITATIQPHTPSAANYERCGFRRLYSRLTFRKP